MPGDGGSKQGTCPLCQRLRGGLPEGGTDLPVAAEEKDPDAVVSPIPPVAGLHGLDPGKEAPCALHPGLGDAGRARRIVLLEKGQGAGALSRPAGQKENRSACGDGQARPQELHRDPGRRDLSRQDPLSGLFQCPVLGEDGEVILPCADELLFGLSDPGEEGQGGAENPTRPVCPVAGRPGEAKEGRKKRCLLCASTRGFFLGRSFFPDCGDEGKEELPHRELLGVQHEDRLFRERPVRREEPEGAGHRPLFCCQCRIEGIP